MIILQSDFEINHAISYAHYVASLPIQSPYLSQALPKVKTLISRLLAQGSSPSSDAPQSSSTSRYSERYGSGSVPQADLCVGLLQALICISWSDDTLAMETAYAINDFLQKVAKMMSETRILSMSKHCRALLIDSFPSRLARLHAFGTEPLSHGSVTF